MRCFWMGPSSPSAEGKWPKNPCMSLWGSIPIDGGQSSCFGSLVQKGKAPVIRRRCLRTSGGVGSKGYGSSSPMIFPGWRRRSRKSFLKRREPLCLTRRGGCAEQSAEEGPGNAGRGPQEDLSCQEPGRGGGSLTNPARTVGHGLSQDRGVLGNQSLCPSCIFTSP